MPIYPLPVLSEEEEEKAIARLKPPTSVVVRYGYMKEIAELPYDGSLVLGCGTKLVVRTQRGVELADMLTTTCANAGCGKSISRQQMLQYIDNSGGKQYPFSTVGKVMRVASVEDLNDQSRLQNAKPHYARVAREVVSRLGLQMKIVEVEPLLSKEKVVFYYTSENRVDFRDLVRELAHELHARIEMRQVGARDEARLVADYEKCGQHCCCKQFLKVLKPISMRSAKVQKATLDPAKISGRCGRLMCCLRYEDESYEELRKRLPHRNSRVKTDDGIGTVINTQILTQLVLVELDSNGDRQAYPVENIELLTGEAARRPPQPPMPAARERPQDRRPAPPRREPPQRPQPGAPLRDEEVESLEGDLESFDETSDSREPGMYNPDENPSGETDDPAAPPPTPTQPANPGATQPAGGTDRQGQGRKRRRRRRRGGGGGPPQGPRPNPGPPQ